jgi:hypothetical protein
VEGGAHRPVERGTPLELDERGRDVRRKADRDARRPVESVVERWTARRAEGIAFRPAAGTRRGEGEIERAPGDRSSELTKAVRHLTSVTRAALPRLTRPGGRVRHRPRVAAHGALRKGQP